MNQPSAAGPPVATTMAELPENAATGELAVIYDEIRRYSAVPYVSSLQRHLATMPGCLEYAWGICRPAFVNGRISQTAWRLAAGVPVEPFPVLSPPALRLLGVDADGVEAIRNICQNFVRVAPVNLLFAGIVERLVQGATPGGVAAGGAGGTPSIWEPPVALAPMPALVPMDSLEPDVQAVLLQLATELGGKPFVPGLYRLIAHWPAYLAHAAALVEPLLRSDEARQQRTAIARTIVAAADDVLAQLPAAAADRQPPNTEQSAAIIAAVHTYRVTSPEMIVFGSLLTAALPLA